MCEEPPSKDHGSMSQLIDILEHYQEPSASDGRNEVLTEDKDQSARSIKSQKPPNVPCSVPYNKNEKEVDHTRTLHQNGSQKRSIIDCNNLNVKMRQSSQGLSDASPFNNSGLFNEITQSLEATRLLHGGKPLPGAPVTLTQVIESGSG